MKNSFSFIVDVAKIALISLIIILPIRYFVAQPFFVRGASMEPTFQDGNYLIVDELSYRLGDPSRGDVVVFRMQDGNSQFLIKRIIGLPGERVEVRDGKVFIEGVELKEPYLSDSLLTAGGITVSLGESDFFVLGDNRSASYDSRQWGSLPADNIIGKAWVRAWPLTSFDFITSFDYES